MHPGRVCSGILYNRENEHTTAICSNIDESKKQHSTEGTSHKKYRNRIQFISSTRTSKINYIVQGYIHRWENKKSKYMIKLVWWLPLMGKDGALEVLE